MQVTYFEKLSTEDAQEYFKQFLNLESVHVQEFLQVCSARGLRIDYSIESISPILEWLSKTVVRISKDPDLSVPEWIRNTDSYLKNLFEFDQPSGVQIMRAAYYFGESFRRTNTTHLRWALGRAQTAKMNMPVVTGFSNAQELAPILVTDNLIRRVAADSEKLPDIKRAIAFWEHAIPCA